MLETKIKNRYGDEFTFIENDKGNIEWHGDFTHHRLGWNDNRDNITMVDPSGGPYLQVGNSLVDYGINGTVAGFINRDYGYEIVVDGLQ